MKICINNPIKRSRQYWKCAKNKLTKNSLSSSDTFADTTDSKKYSKNCQRRIESDYGSPEMEETNMVGLNEKLYKFQNNNKKHKNQEKYGKKKYISSS
jgi:bisphosphoglycerate-dependent phosphoglycerate mutase